MSASTSGARFGWRRAKRERAIETKTSDGWFFGRRRRLRLLFGCCISFQLEFHFIQLLLLIIIQNLRSIVMAMSEKQNELRIKKIRGSSCLAPVQWLTIYLTFFFIRSSFIPGLSLFLSRSPAVVPSLFHSLPVIFHFELKIVWRIWVYKQFCQPFVVAYAEFCLLPRQHTHTHTWSKTQTTPRQICKEKWIMMHHLISGRPDRQTGTQRR